MSLSIILDCVNLSCTSLRKKSFSESPFLCLYIRISVILEVTVLYIFLHVLQLLGSFVSINILSQLLDHVNVRSVQETSIIHLPAETMFAVQDTEKDS